MNLRWTRLLAIWLTALLLLAAAGPAAQIAWATEDEPPQEILAPSWYWESWLKGAQAGSSVAGAGDVNKDGYADVIVGAPKFYEKDGIYKGGAAFLFRGISFGLDANPYWSAFGEAQGNGFGSAVASAGDVNCDGYPDVIVSAPSFETNNGKVYVYHGSSSGLSAEADWTYTGPVRDIFMGWSVAGVGNVNGDSHNGKSCDDILVGAKFFADGEDKEGGAFLFYGSPTGLSAVPVWAGQVNKSGAQFGYSVSGAGDVNGDGYADVIVGAPYFREALLNQGAIFLYYGSAAGLKESPDWYALGAQAEAKLGYSVSGAGNVNGDDYDDIAAGAPGGFYTAGAVYVQGGVFVYHGSAGGPGLEADWSQVEQGQYTGYGTAVAGAGEVNGDDFDDLLVGAWRYSNDQSKEGVLYVHHGGAAGLAQHPGWRAEGNKADTGFGYAVAAAGDITGDGFGDIVVGAPYYRLGGEIMGRAFVYHGFLQEVVDGEIQPRMHYLFLPITTH